MNKDEQILLFFVKYPTPGKVKTRLAQTMGEEAAAALYGLFVEDMLDGLDTLPVRLVVCHDPEADAAAMGRWLGQEREYLPQEGKDVGERMAAALAWAFAQGAKRAAVMGSDVPDYPPVLVERAFAELLFSDVLLGPAMDGGYYLIAFHSDSFDADSFEGIPWSGPGVLAATREKLEKAGRKVGLLPEWNDVDVFRDLNVLYRQNSTSSFRQSRTFAKLKEYEDRLAEYDLDLPGSTPTDEVRRAGDKA